MMKHLKILIIWACVLILPFTPIVSAGIDYTVAELDFTARKYIMQLNQQPVKLEISPVWRADTASLLIPLRFIAEMNRFVVQWDSKTSTASFSRGNTHFSVKIQYSQIQLKAPMNTPHYRIELRNNRLLLDHRTIETLFPIQAELIETNQEVIFTTDRDNILYKAPTFTLKDLKGNQVDLQKILQLPTTQLVVLNFYSTRCPICAKALPNLQKLNEDYRQKGIIVLGINTDTQNMEAERDEVIKKYGLSYPILLDPNANTYTAYSVAGIPNLFVINPQREIIQHRLGVDDSYFVFLRQYLDVYLNSVK